MSYDKRNKQTRRRFIVEIIDQTNIPFEGKDLEELGDAIQAHMKDKFDAEIDHIHVEKFSDYKNEWVTEDTLPS
jgi:hypothetical protein